MELLDRYLQAVKKHLPWKRQDDIIAELRANFEAQLEDKETGLGRPLTTGEAEDWLKQIGPPRQVAARYQPQQYLIGPALFPSYLFVLRTVCFWTMIAYTIGSVALLATGTVSGSRVLEAVLRAPGFLLTVAGWVTLGFAAIEFAATRRPEKFPTLSGSFSNWTPSTLPPLEKDAVHGKKPRSLASAVAEVVFGFLFLVWLLLIPQHPYLLMGPGSLYLPYSPFQFAPVWVPVFWWVVAVNVVQVVWRCVDLIRGAWRQPRRAELIVISAIGLVPLGMLLAVPDHAYFTLKNVADQARYGAALDSINLSIKWSVLVICAIVVLELVWALARMSLEAYRRRAASMQ
ncbi:MAG: hypothetical protein ABSE55_15150 [Terracidiphilus sp.]|jgi:hypothetical protein